MSTPHGIEPVRRTVSEDETLRANRRDWDAYADEYQATHGEFLGDARFIWSPEGVDEAAVHVLGDVSGCDVLEIGCGAAQCARWLTTRGARTVGLDVSHRQLQHGRRIDADTGTSVPTVCGTATALPFEGGSFDVAFSVTHPIRWSMPDDPSVEGLVVTSSYWDRTPYVEQDATGAVTYAEHHRTVGDWVRILAGSGFRLEDLIEPEWPEGHDRVWGGWGPVRGALIPGTAIFSARLG